MPATFAREIEHSRLAILPDAGHAVFLDQHERTLAVIQEFLTSLNAGG